MRGLSEPFNNNALKPLNNPRESERLFFKEPDFFKYAYALKWNLADTGAMFDKYFVKDDFLSFYRFLYLIYSLDGSKKAYDFLKKYGVFNSLRVNKLLDIDFLILVMKIYRDVGTYEDIEFGLQLITSRMRHTLPKTVKTPNIYTNASLHTLLVENKKQGKNTEFARKDTNILLDVFKGNIQFSNAEGKNLKLNKAKKVFIAGMVRIRNEEDYVSHLVDSLKDYVDVIIVYDDCSTDSTVESFIKLQQSGLNIEIIKGDKWLFNEALIHKIIVDKGRELGVTHFLQLDADESLASSFTPKIFREIMGSMTPGDVLSLPWLNVDDSLKNYYDDSKVVGLKPSYSLKRYKDIAFADDGFTQYAEWLYAHVNTAPFVYARRFIAMTDKLSLVHLEQVNLINYVAKKDWYRLRAYAQNNKLPSDPYLNIQLHLLQLDESISFNNDVLVTDYETTKDLFNTLNMERIESNIKGCDLYPKAQSGLFLNYDYFSNSFINNSISEK